MKVLAIISGLLLFSTVVCGLWIRYSAEPVEDSSITFHMVIGLVTAAACVITIVLGAFKG